MTSNREITMTTTAVAVDDYIDALPAATREVMRELQRRIRTAAPDVAESISYQIGKFQLDERHGVFIGAWKQHIGIYVVAEVDEELARALESYRTKTSTLRFPLKQPMPYELIDRMIAAIIAGDPQ